MASICRGLKVDPKPVLDLMPGIGNSRLGVGPPPINARFEPAGSSSGASWRSRPSPIMFAVLLLLLGALAIYFYPMGAVDSDPAPDAASPSPGTVEMTVPSEAVAPSAPASAVPNALLNPPLPAPGASAAQAAAPVAPAASPESDALMVFTAKGESWVQVTDAKGVALVRRTLQANERVTATGTLPLSVVVGRIDVVDVQLRGQTMDLRSIAKTNVARFEVK